MSKTTTIAGVNFDLNFAKKINTQPIPLNEISKQPITNIYKSDKGSKETPIYTVNILSYIPQEINKNPKADGSGFFVVPELVFFQYNGTSLVETEVVTTNENRVTSRSFEIVYDGTEKQTEFDLFHIQLEYHLTGDLQQAVEAIWVRDENLDPRTDRGTVSTPRWP